ncbi:hypothetical protein KY359_05550 [Candidatus Woesearchaeota archaeon]|nr:hypothetical protein [Candidatus Woesearchaeota archaeon]
MEQEEKNARMKNTRELISNMMVNRGTLPFPCPHLVIAQKEIRNGKSVFEKGDLICTSGFLDMCCIFNTAKADEEGNISAVCRKDCDERKIIFRKA